MPAVTLCPTFGVGYQSFTNGGLPNNIGYVYTYIAGGTTPQATYTTADGDVLNDNPIVFTASGRPPNEIWLILGNTYRLDLYDADDNLIKSYDDVGGGGGGTTTLTNLTVVNNITTNNITAENDGEIEGDLHVGGNTQLDGDLNVDGLITNGGLPIYSGIPIDSHNAGYSVVALDRGRGVLCATAGAFNIPASLDTGFVVSFFASAGICTITSSSDTLRLAGTASTGTRTVAQYGVATAWKVSSTVWVVTGQGVS